jgi:hypothetical protein
MAPEGSPVCQSRGALMEWLRAIVVVIAALGGALFFRRWRSERRAQAWLEAHSAVRDPTPPVLDRASVERLWENPEFGELRGFFANYFHEDWSYDAADEQAAVQLFLDVATADEVRAVRSEIDRLLALGFTDEQMDEGLGVLGCNYKPEDWPAVPWEANEWVRGVRELLTLGQDPLDCR